MFCKNCGRELPDSAKFCGACGARVSVPAAAGGPASPKPPVEAAPPTPPAPPAAPKAPAAEPAAGERAPIEEDPVREIPRPAPVPSAAPGGEAGQESGGAPAKKGKGKLIMLGAGVAAVVAVVAAIILLKPFSGMGSGGSKRAPAYAYLTSDDELMYLSDLKEKTDALEITDEGSYSANVQFSPNGKTIYYKDRNDTLYAITASALKKEDRPERIARGITWFTVLDSGKVLFAEYDGTNKLSLYDGKDSFRLIKDYENYEVGEDGKTLYYTERDSKGELTLYKMAMTEDAKEVELLDGAAAIYTPYDAALLIYSESSQATGDQTGASASDSYQANNDLTILACKPGGEAEELVSDICFIQGAEVKDGKADFYYAVEKVEERTLYDFVTDTSASEDAALAAEELVRPSWYGEFYPESTFFDGYHWAYIDSLGKTHMLDDTVLIDTYGTAGSDLSTYDAQRAARDAAQELYNAAQEEYNAKYEAYREAVSRNSLREDLKNSRYDQQSYDFYHFAGGEPESPIAEQVDYSSMYYRPESGLFLYQKTSSTGGKVCDIAELNYSGEVYDYLSAGGSSGDWYQNVGGAESGLELEEDTYINGLYVLNGKEAVLDLYDGEERSLAAYSLGDTALTFTSAILEDEEFSGVSVGKDAKGSDVLYLFTDVDLNGEVGDFSRWSGGELETLAKEVYGAVVLDESGVTYAVTERDDYGDQIELSVVGKDGKLSVISDEIDVSHEPIFLDDKQILYMNDGDLYLWDGKEERRVARDVELVWANAQAGYSSYSIYG